MRKTLWLLANLLVVMLLTSVAMAETHKVQGGETLSGIAKKYGVTVKAIKSVNPIVTNINHIRPGWKLEIPAKESVASKATLKAEEKKKSSGKKAASQKAVEKKAVAAKKLPPIDVYVPGEAEIRKGFYAKPGVAPTKMNNEDAFDYLRLSDEVQQKLNQAIQNGNGVPSYIKPGDQFLMTYGWNGIVDATLKYEGQLAATQYLIEDSKGIVHDIRYIFWCHNWTRYPELPPRIEAPPLSIPPPPEAREPAPPITAVIPPVAKAPPPETPCLDNWDWYIGGGDYYSRVQGRDNNGGYGWTKFRMRPCPLWFTPEENVLGIKNVGLGFVVFLAGGDGIAAKYYDYNWREVAGGFTAKAYAQHSDYDFDLMIGRLWNEGSWRGNQDRDQIDDFFLASIHANVYRDDPDALWLHKYELNAEGRFPFHTEMRKGTKVNNRVIEGTYTQWIYKSKLGEDDSFNVSPGFNFGLGYEWASEEEGFGKVGPAFELASYDNVIAGISVLNYKTNNGGQWHPISGYISIDGAWRAYKASQITSVSEEDLKGLENGSKLLNNPADFL